MKTRHAILCCLSSFAFMSSGFSSTLELAEQFFAEQDYQKAALYFDAFLSDFVPQTEEESQLAYKALWNRATCQFQLGDEKGALEDLFVLIQKATDEGFEVPNFTPFPFQEEEFYEMEEEKKPHTYFHEGKEYVKERWKSVKSRAKKAWSYLKEKHRKYRVKRGD